MGVGAVAAAPTRRSGGRGRLLVALVVVAVVAGAALYFVLGSQAQAATATVSVVQTAMQAQRAGAGFATALDGDVLATGDQVRTDASGRGFLTFFDGSTLEVDPGALVTVTDLSRSADGSFVIRVRQTLGKTWANVQKLANPGSRFEIETPSSTAVVRGTAFETIVQADGTSTFQTAEGAVAVSAQGQTRTASAGNQVTTASGQAPGAPQPIPPGPGLRVSSPDGTGLIVFTPSGLACGSGRADAPGCTAGGVVLTQAEAGTYVVLVSASTSVTATLSLEGRFGSTTVSSQTLSRPLAKGDLVRTTVDVMLAQGRPVVGVPTPFEAVSSTCAGEAPGRLFATGAVADRGAELQRFAASNRARPVALVFTNAELTDALKSALASQDLPITVLAPAVQTTVQGLTLAGDVVLGPLTVHATATFVAGQESGRLVLHLRTLDLGPFTALAADQLRTRIEQELASAGNDLPIAVQRVAFRAGCVAVIGRTR